MEKVMAKLCIECVCVLRVAGERRRRREGSGIEKASEECLSWLAGRLGCSTASEGTERVLVRNTDTHASERRPSTAPLLPFCAPLAISQHVPSPSRL